MNGEPLTLALALVAGLVSFVSPCVLALIPVYLAFLSEAAAAPLARGGPDGAGAPPPTRSVLVQALLFVAGFGAVFVLLGISAGLIGARLFAVPGVREVAGVLVVILGLATMAAWGPLATTGALPVTAQRLPVGRFLRSAALGALVGIGWTPCIGAVLGSILMLAGSAQQVGPAALLLTAYSIGLALPFLAVAVALPRLRPLLTFLRRHHRGVELVSGAFIVMVGVMILTNTFTVLAGLFTTL
ncbi:MAG: cytochrome c biogenesis protein CcdA [Chloroflexota bacterium]